MNKIIFSIVCSFVFIVSLASLGLASILWKTNNIPRAKVSLSYIDPTSGLLTLKNFSGVGLNYLEVNQDLSNNYHYVLLHTENYSDMLVQLSAVGGGLSTSRGTEINGMWRSTGLNENTIKFGSLLLDAEMVADDIRAVVMTGTNTANSMNTGNPSITMVAAGLLTIGPDKTPAKVTVQVSAKGVPAVIGNYTSIGSDFVAHPPSLSGAPIASSFSQDLTFGAPAPAIDVIANSPHYDKPLTVNIPSGGDALLNGTLSPGTGADVNKIIYTPKEGFSGKDTFQYRLISDLSQSDPATVTVNVGPRPHAVLQNYTTTKDSIAKDYAYAPASDWDPTIFTPTVPALSDMGGALSIDSGKFNYSPAAGFEGTDFVTYTLTDKLLRTITGTAIFEVRPHAVGDSFTYSVVSNTFTPALTTANLLSNDKGSGLSVGDVLKVGTFATPDLVTPPPAASNITYVPISHTNGDKEYFAYSIKDNSAPAKMSSGIVTIIIGP